MVLEKKIFLNFFNVFSLFCNYLPLEKSRALNLNNLESPSPKDALCQVWLKLAQWFWRIRFLNVVNVFSLFHNYLPLEKGWAFHLNKLESPSHKDALCQIWLKLAQWFWRRWKCEKFTDRQTVGQKDRWRTKGDQKSSLELSAQGSSGELKTKYKATNYDNIFLTGRHNDLNIMFYKST